MILLFSQVGVSVIIYILLDVAGASKLAYCNFTDTESAAPAKDWDAISSVSSDLIPTTVSQYYPIDHQAKKIMDLISDIGKSTLADKPVLDTFHPCSVCSGRLITV